MQSTADPKALSFLILGLRIFFQNIKVRGGKKIKLKITKKNFLFNLKHIWMIPGSQKKNNKNCMILHCKNAEMTIIVISACLQCKIIQFLLIFFIFYFFLNLTVFYIRENKKSQK